MASNKPAPAKSAYGFFTKSRHEWYSANDKSKPMGDRMKEISAAWKALDAGGKKKFDKLAEQDRARFERESDEADAAAAAEQEAKRAQRDGDATGPRGCKRPLEEKAAKPRKKVEMSAARKKQIAADRAEREQREENIEEEREALRERMAEAAQARLKYLLSQSDIFGHFGSGVTAAAKAASRGRDGGAAASPRTPKSPSKRRARVDSAGDDDDDDAVARRESVSETRLLAQPACIAGKMRPYQLEGLNWMIRLQEHGMNGILADEMGLGKTLQSISVLGWLAEAQGVKGPHLVLVPKSTLGNWMNEFARWCPEMLKAVRFHGSKPEREAFIRDVLKPGCAPGERDWDVCVTTYEVANAEARALEKLSWRFVIIDEAHRIKNEASLFARTARSLRAERRLLVTGTPLQNNLHELWALLNFLLPDVFASSDQFDEWFDLDVEDEDAKKTMITQLHKLLRPFVLRRLKVDVEKSLPPKTETILFTGLSVSQKQVYKSLLKRDASLLAGPEAGGDRAGASRAKMANIAMQLRKCCNHPYLFEGVEDKSLPPFGDHLVTNCGKMRVLDKLLLRCKQQGSRVLIFSQMTRVLDILEDYCAYRHDEGFSYCRIDGSTGGDDRQDSIDAFNATDSTVFLFLLSTRAGGLGINLQTADVVVLFDSDWNPQADLQAQDRAHRIGQKKEVKVFRFVTVDSIEEKVLERAERKLQMDYAVVQQGRLAEKAKGVSKEEALAAVRYGADKQFRMAADKDITDEEIDVLLATTKNLTAEREALLKDKEKKDLLDFSNAEVNFQEFDGVDYKALQSHGDMEFMSEMQDAMGKRERAAGSYNERDYQRVPAAAPVEKGMPKAKKLPDYKEHQFFNVKRIIELYELQHKRETSKARQIQRLMETGGEAAEAELAKVQEAGETEEEKAQRTELEGLEAEGFLSWSKNDYSKFLKECERSGRDEFAKIAEQVATKSVDEVKAYAAAFWGGKGAQHIGDFEKQVKKIEDGEKKMKEKEMMSKDLKAKVSSTPNPWINLQIKYGNNRGKLFTESEDRFLLCMTDQLGYGMWEDLKREVRRSPEFRFDWLFKSRTPAELGRRCDLLIRLIQTEAGSGPAKSRGPKKGEAAGSGAMEVDA